ncbi:uncharacterized protein LOC581417 isoform X2 [Strongylocentrotus purpuratus]|nr:uncharacterized protein LOC581417 isoform X2 [Strongylocentrotus purpuratus]XP_800134.1 uncharacterized protein LOC581417 isoform X2 [Strongylocentrotus purpuratus]|eukprot:XP_011671707.1 PREDICTED: uncharacterized protein LOC581417 isoform X2 [Strongylocentrotus purpuratus]
MLKRILSKNFCALQNALGTSWNVQASRCLGHTSSTVNTSNPPKRQETLKVLSPSLSAVLVNNPSSRQQQGTCPETLGRLLSRLSLSPEEAVATIQYTLPTRSPVAQVAILDPVASVAIPWDCPTAVTEDSLDVPSSQRVDVFIDDPATNRGVAKKASNILQKRHRKMKRHQYKKWRKRNRFKLRMQKQRRRKKQKARWERHLNRFRFAELKPSEGQQYLAKKQEKLHLYLNYHGVDVDDGSARKEISPEESKKRQKKGPIGTCVISSQGTGSITPKPLVPVGVKL